MKNLDMVISAAIRRMTEPRVEPVKRKVAGVYGWAVHRYPIKGGISIQEAQNRDHRELLRRLCGVPMGDRP